MPYLRKNPLFYRIKQVNKVKDFPALKENEQLCDLNIAGMSIIQDKEHFRFTTDSVLLAGFCGAPKGARCVDLGAGQGILSVLLFARYGVSSVEAVEIQETLCDMARRSAAYNGLTRLTVHHRDLRGLQGILREGTFDFVVCNPPYQPQGTGRQSPDPARRTALYENECTLADVLETGLGLLRFSGRMCLCLRPSRLCDLAGLSRKFGGELKRMRLVHPYADAPPSLLLAEVRRGGRPELAVEPPLILYREKGVPTREFLAMYGERVARE